MMPARMLAHSPWSAWAAALFEVMIEKSVSKIDVSLVKMVRIQTSLVSGCPFCVDMNAFGYWKDGISHEKARALKDGTYRKHPDFTDKEITLLDWIREICQTPIDVKSQTVDKVKQHFSEKEIVRLAAFSAKVVFWSRFIQAVGIPPAEYGGFCEFKGDS